MRSGTARKLVTGRVDNPYFNHDWPESDKNPRQIEARINPRESYVGYLYHRKTINAGQKRAGDRIRWAFETLDGLGASGIDLTNPRVDKGGVNNPYDIRQIQALRLLRQAQDILGKQDYQLTLRMAGEGLWPRDIVARRTRARVDEKHLAMRFRQCLKTLAKNFGWE